jgi:hypothetical protein
MSDREELMDELDAGVFSGDLLFTDLEAFKEYVARWQRAIDEHEKHNCKCGHDTCADCKCNLVDAGSLDG